MKTIYHYDGRTGELVYIDTEYMPVHGVGLPAHSTDIEPLPPSVGKAIVFENGQWGYVPDHRGKDVWDKETKTKTTISRLGEIPEHLTIIPLPEEHYVWNGDAWQKDDIRLISLIKSYAATLITASGHDWMAIRQITGGIPVPQNVLDYANGVRSASQTLEHSLPDDYTDPQYWPVLQTEQTEE